MIMWCVEYQELFKKKERFLVEGGFRDRLKSEVEMDWILIEDEFRDELKSEVGMDWILVEGGFRDRLKSGVGIDWIGAEREREKGVGRREREGCLGRGEGGFGFLWWMVDELDDMCDGMERRGGERRGGEGGHGLDDGEGG